MTAAAYASFSPNVRCSGHETPARHRHRPRLRRRARRRVRRRRAARRRLDRGHDPLDGRLIRASGPITLDLWSADWKLAPGHRIAVRVTDANTDWWLHAPTKQAVTVHGGSISLPFLAEPRTTTIDGQPGTQLPSYLAKRVTVPASTLNSSTSPEFQTPE
jgi:hypothetical protein